MANTAISATKNTRQGISMLSTFSFSEIFSLKKRKSFYREENFFFFRK